MSRRRRCAWTQGPKLPLAGLFLSLALPLALTHREKLQEQKEVWGSGGAERGQSSGEGVQKEKSQRGHPPCPSLSSGDLPASTSLLCSNPWAAKPDGWSRDQAGGYLPSMFPPPSEVQCLEMTGGKRHLSIREKGGIVFATSPISV